jgi:hypothetical protein
MDFILPKWGGAMIHSDPHLTDFIDLPIPKENVDKIWHRNELASEKMVVGNGVASNGEIVACTYFGPKHVDNLVIYDYDGKRLWTSGNKLNLISASSSPMVDINNRVVACDNKKLLMVQQKNKKFEIAWESNIPYNERGILIPFSPTISKGKTIIIPTNGPIYAYDVNSGRILGLKRLGEAETDKTGYYTTVNSACVNEDKVYIATEFNVPGRIFGKLQQGRFYALKVHPDASEDEVFEILWSFPYIGTSQASPLFINNTLYFDGFTPGLFNKVYIFAVTDKGECYTVQQVAYPDKKTILPQRTMFSFSKDPRGGFWYEDHRGKKLVHFDEKNLHKIEEIPLKNLPPVLSRLYRPLSDMTICDKKKPVMLISATHMFYGQHLVALDLENNSVIWSKKIGVFNYAGGQFTILIKKSKPYNPRVVFGTYWDGIMAFGSKNRY